MGRKKKAKEIKQKFSVGDTISKKKLIDLFPEDYRSQRMWDAEKADWESVNISKRLTHRKYKFTTIDETKLENTKNAIIYIVTSSGGSQKVRWFNYYSKERKQMIVSKPMVINTPVSQKSKNVENT